jgi:hypothetical protein
MFGGNRFKLAVFGSNCSSGRAATKVPERWQNSFEENIRLAQMADAAGLECLVPVGRARPHSWRAARCTRARQTEFALKISDFQTSGHF